MPVGQAPVWLYIVSFLYDVVRLYACEVGVDFVFPFLCLFCKGLIVSFIVVVRC